MPIKKLSHFTLHSLPRKASEFKLTILEGHSFSLLPGFAVHLWKIHNKGDIVTEEVVKEEYIRCAGPEFFHKQYTQFSTEFEEAFQMMHEFIDEADREYHSGLMGFFRSLRKRFLHINRKQSEYKRLHNVALPFSFGENSLV